MPFIALVIVGWQERRSDQREAAPCMTSESEEGITGTKRPKRVVGFVASGFSEALLSSSLPTSLHPLPSRPLPTVTSTAARLKEVRRSFCRTVEWNRAEAVALWWERVRRTSR